MAIISQVITQDDTQPNGERVLKYQYTFHTGQIHTVGPITISAAQAPTFDANADMLARIPALEARFADNEIGDAFAEVESNVDKRANGDTLTDFTTYKVPPDHSPQVDFDRKLLGMLMTVRDCETFREGYEFFLAQQARNGNNNVQRAANLGVPLSEYVLVDNRFDDVSGVLFFIDGDKGQVWDQPLDGWA